MRAELRRSALAQVWSQVSQRWLMAHLIPIPIGRQPVPEVPGLVAGNEPEKLWPNLHIGGVVGISATCDLALVLPHGIHAAGRSMASFFAWHALRNDR